MAFFLGRPAAGAGVEGGRAPFKAAAAAIFENIGKKTSIFLL